MFDSLPSLLLLIFQSIPLPLWAGLVVLLLLKTFGVAILRFLGWRKPSHRRKERQACRSLAQLANISDPGRQFGYLRKVDPFVFEEMILEAYERRGHKVKRSHRYTGDGGIDGRVWIDGRLHLIQAKRYSGHINVAHVWDFCQLVAARGCGGIFVHTGRTGGASRRLAAGNESVSIISGQRLLDLLTVKQ